jgi:PiT family inorganic phosphate transporter
VNGICTRSLESRCFFDYSVQSITAAAAFVNGANDNFKGVAILFGSGLASYRRALAWATVTTLAGSAASAILAQGLLHRFSGMGLVPATLAASPAFALAVAFGAAATVILATRFGFPVSTTHAILGAPAGAGWAAVGAGALKFGALGKGFVLPLLSSPLVAIALGALIFTIVRQAQRRLWAARPVCVCVDVSVPPEAVVVGAGALGLRAAAPPMEIAALPASDCAAGRPGVLAVDSG